MLNHIKLIKRLNLKDSQCSISTKKGNSINFRQMMKSPLKAQKIEYKHFKTIYKQPNNPDLFQEETVYQDKINY